jgi:hypothetical protein
MCIKASCPGLPLSVFASLSMERRSSAGLRILVVAAFVAAANLIAVPWGFAPGLVSSQTPERSVAQAAAKKKVAEAAAAPAAAVDVQPKRPVPAYMLWLSEERPKIVKKLGAEAKMTEVAKEAGKQWGELAEAKKAPFEKKYTENKAKYTADLEAFKAAGGVLLARKSKTTSKTTEGAKTKKVKDPNQPTRPKSSYIIFMSENREKIVKGMPTGFKITEVMSEGGKQWKALPDAKKKPYVTKAAELKKEYEKQLAAYKP